MGIQVEFNPDLCLRAYDTPERRVGECLPEKLIEGNTYNFWKRGQRNYWLEGEIPLRETKGNQQLSKPLASITIMAAKHGIFDDVLWTTGHYRVNEVYNINNPTIHFEGMEKVK
jgi:hypothetical protein